MNIKHKQFLSKMNDDLRPSSLSDGNLILHVRFVNPVNKEVDPAMSSGLEE